MRWRSWTASRAGRRENVPEGALLYEMDVRRSVAEPAFDADVNVLGTVRLPQNCVEHGVARAVFASSGGTIYGEQDTFPAAENHPQYPVSPYGVSKLAGGHHLYFYNTQYGLRIAAPRYWYRYNWRGI